MVASMNYIQSQTEVNIPLNVSPENGLRDPSSEQRTPFSNEGSGRIKQKVDWCTWKPSRKDIAIIILALLLLVSGTLNFVQLAQVKQPEAASTPKPLTTTSCPPGWVLNAELCYFFSGTESTWDSACSNCSSSGGSLFVMATKQDETFINENKAPTEYWLGLRREKKEQPWKQLDGTVFNNSSRIKGEGLCASLNDDVISSTDCDSLRHWICSKHRHAV